MAEPIAPPSIPSRTLPDDDLTPEDAPPPYEPRRSNPAPTSTTGNRARQQQRQPPVVDRQFPQEFNLYSASALGRRYNMGVHQDAPFYAVSTHSGIGWGGSPDVVLHTTTDPKSPPLATAAFKAFSNDVVVALPPLGPGSSDEKLLEGRTFARAFSFSVEVPRPNGGSGLHTEPFEWRHSSGDEVRTLSPVWGGGWKLVRVGAPASGGPTASDSREIVAAFTEGTMSLTKKFCFKFFGAGESGVLGERWAVMAVITAMAIWEKLRRTRKNRAVR